MWTGWWRDWRAPRTERVRFDADEVVRTMRNGREERVRWDALCEVGIITTDDGPFAEDCYWLLIGDDGTGCAVPNGAEGLSALLERLQRLPGFDNEAVVAAMSCVEPASFTAWRREGLAGGAQADRPREEGGAR